MARNTSDSIEEYIKELLQGQSGIAEIQRSNLADTSFKLYRVRLIMLTKTRFTESRLYC